MVRWRERGRQEPTEKTTKQNLLTAVLISGDKLHCVNYFYLNALIKALVLIRATCENKYCIMTFHRFNFHIHFTTFTFQFLFVFLSSCLVLLRCRWSTNQMWEQTSTSHTHLEVSTPLRLERVCGNVLLRHSETQRQMYVLNETNFNRSRQLFSPERWMQTF